MLVRQIAGIGGPGGSLGATEVLSSSVDNPTGVVAITLDQPAPPADADTPAPCNCQDTTPIMWAGLSIGTALLLAKAGPTIAGTVGKKKGSMLIPLLIVGGLGAYWYFTQRSDSSTSTASSTTTDTERAGLMNRYAGQSIQLAAINSADAETIRKWALLSSIWNAGTDPYAIDTNGNPTTNRAASIGAWWELFSQQKGF